MISNLKGNIGSPGFPGDSGEKGQKGTMGIPGTPGTQGHKGDQGLIGYPGKIITATYTYYTYMYLLSACVINSLMLWFVIMNYYVPTILYPGQVVQGSLVRKVLVGCQGPQENLGVRDVQVNPFINFNALSKGFC